VAFLCRFYGVSRAGFYAWRDRPESGTVEENRKLLKAIVRVHRQSREIYGSPRVIQDLRKQGVCVSKHRVARLMRENNLRGRVVRVTRRQPGLHRFCVGSPNQLRTAGKADRTKPAVGRGYHLSAGAGKMEIPRCGARPLFPQGHQLDIGDRRTVDLTWRAMHAAIVRRNPPQGLLFHTDRGIEYRHPGFRELLAAHGIEASMNRPGQTTDNAYVESFFHTLKAEYFRGRWFNNTQELRQGLAGDINHFYNRQRMHSGIGYRSPDEYEQRAV